MKKKLFFYPINYPCIRETIIITVSVPIRCLIDNNKYEDLNKNGNKVILIKYIEWEVNIWEINDEIRR